MAKTNFQFEKRQKELEKKKKKEEKKLRKLSKPDSEPEETPLAAVGDSSPPQA